MSPPRRRSSRLRTSATPENSRKITPLTALKLSSLIERDETPEYAHNNLDTVVSSPIAPPNTAMTQHNAHFTSSAIHTPTTASCLYPSLEEMHPSKAQQSTTKQPDSGLILGFGSPRELLQGGRGLAAAQGTPTKANQTMAGPPSSPGFEFKFTRPESELSSEAQKMMEGLREEAARIKAKLAAERDEERSKNGDEEELVGVGGRRIAKPKGKAGRYSDLHMEEFKKMDSIAGHPSAFRAQPGRFQPATTSLKRSKSQAKLDEPGNGLTRTKSTKSLRSERNDDDASTGPAKRAKKHAQDDTSYLRPLSRDGEFEIDGKTSTPTLPRSKSGLPTAITTPTKASLARSASVKHVKTSMIPSLARSPSVKSLASPGSKTEGSKKYLSSLARLGSMKSILRRPQPLFSDDPLKQAAGTHIATPKGQSDLNKVLPDLPNISSEVLQRTPTKHVNFTPTTLAKCDLAAASPSRSKIPSLQPQQKAEPGTLNVSYPSLPKAVAPSPSPIKVRNSGPGDFTFRSDKTLNFGAGQTIRQVLPNDTATTEALSKSLPAVPHGIPNKKRHRDDSDEEATLKSVNNNAVSTSIPTLASMPTVPHGMPNKKRKHDNSDDEDIENKDDSQGPKAKKIKSGAQWEPSTSSGKSVPESKKKIKATSRIPKAGATREKGKGILSMSRLNMLARPKERKGGD
ncbi:MAG: hypothetical protein M1812_002708 [Candelaria pacifica]|nr:MAG: hypothetical protein M1812_002708 [Candelaria pacifica]